ncbi:type 4a pilus biogenesis protein PilO [Sulfurimonas sp.]|nr:type 4a pilus biogenesis protein PilO [Sulfurimonas sp.]
MNFKLMLEDNLHKVDNFFKDKTKKDTYYVYIMVVGIIAGLSYPFYDLSVDEFMSAKDKVNSVSQKLSTDKIYLKVNPETKIVKIEQDIKRLQTELQINKENNEYIKSKIDTISSLIYDERAWGEYINSISKNAKRNNVKILNFTNKYSTNTEEFGHMLDITLDVKGNYQNTIKFINSLEQSELVVDVHHLNMKAENALNTRLNISVWGITY